MVRCGRKENEQRESIAHVGIAYVAETSFQERPGK